MSKQYDEYLESHIANVGKAARWMEKNLTTVERMTDDEVEGFLGHVEAHDVSKYGPDEYDAYDAYFYGDRDDEAFDRAWLSHIHDNPHHWQHWMLVNDDGTWGDKGKVEAIEMPKDYALEMVADWWSFSWRSGNLHDVFDWYETHRDGIVLHQNTRRFVEDVLDEIRLLLGDQGDDA